MANIDYVQRRRTAKESLIYFVPFVFLSEVLIVSRRQKQGIIRDSALSEEKKTNERNLRRVVHS